MEFLDKLIELNGRTTPYTMGVVVHAQGSTPQKVGCRAVLTSDGLEWGTLGGGMVEAKSLAKMHAALNTETHELFEFRLDESYSRDAGPICGGVMRILAEPSTAQSIAPYQEARASLASGERGVLVTLLESSLGASSQTQWIEESAFNGAANLPTKEDLLNALVLNEAVCVSVGDDEFFVDPLQAPPRLLVVGGGHVGQEVVRQAVALGFDVALSDDREEFRNPDLFPEEVNILSTEIADAVSGFRQDENAYIILVSKGHKPDAIALEACIHGDAKYIGMIGSRRKIRFLKKHFLEEGLATPEEFARIVAPIGFEIGAVTVPEIGVSIAAQLIAARRLARTDCRSMNDPARVET